MITKVIFNMDKKLKVAAMKKAKAHGTNLTSIFNAAARAYVSSVQNVDPLREAIEQGVREFHEGKTIAQDDLFKRYGL